MSARRKTKTLKTATYEFVDWSSVDWSKSSVVIARKLGKDASQVSRARRIHAPETLDQSKRACKPEVQWEKQDWTKSNKALAWRTGCDPSYVSARRAIHAPETLIRREAWRNTRNLGKILAACLNDEEPDLTHLIPANLQLLVAASSRLRTACLAAGGTQPRTIGKYNAPRTGLAGKVRAWINRRKSNFTIEQLETAFPDEERMKIQSAVGHAVRQGHAVLVSGQGTNSRTYKRA